MKKITLFATRYILPILVILFMSLPSSAAAQNQKDDLEALRVAFITKELKLTSDESQKFWPIYNEYLKELSKLRKDAAGDDSGDDVAYKQDKLNLRKKYTDKLKAVIPDTKVNELPKAEKEFKKWLLEKISNSK